MTAPIVTPETTLRELGEILRRNPAVTLTGVYHDYDGAQASVVTPSGHYYGSPGDLAAAINDALTKAGAR